MYHIYVTYIFFLNHFKVTCKYHDIPHIKYFSIQLLNIRIFSSKNNILSHLRKWIINWFFNIKSARHPWGKSNLVIMYYPLNIAGFSLLIVVLWYLHLCSWVRLAYNFPTLCCPCKVLECCFGTVLYVSIKLRLLIVLFKFHKSLWIFFLPNWFIVHLRVLLSALWWWIFSFLF